MYSLKLPWYIQEITSVLEHRKLSCDSNRHGHDLMGCCDPVETQLSLRDIRRRLSLMKTVAEMAMSRYWFSGANKEFNAQSADEPTICSSDSV